MATKPICGKTEFAAPDLETRRRLLEHMGGPERLVRERKTITGLSGTHWRLLEQQCLVLARLCLGCKAVAWRLSDLLYWIEKLQVA